MKHKLSILSYGGAVLMLLLLIGMGAIQINSNFLKYGSSYEVVTIIEGEETRITQSLSMNLAFIGFLVWIFYLLLLPLIDYVKDSRTSKESTQIC